MTTQASWQGLWVQWPSLLCPASFKQENWTFPSTPYPDRSPESVEDIREKRTGPGTLPQAGVVHQHPEEFLLSNSGNNHKRQQKKNEHNNQPVGGNASELVALSSGFAVELVVVLRILLGMGCDIMSHWQCHCVVASCPSIGIVLGHYALCHTWLHSWVTALCAVGLFWFLWCYAKRRQL